MAEGGDDTRTLHDARNAPLPALKGTPGRPSPQPSPSYGLAGELGMQPPSPQPPPASTSFGLASEPLGPRSPAPPPSSPPASFGLASELKPHSPAPPTSFGLASEQGTQQQPLRQPPHSLQPAPSPQYGLASEVAQHPPAPPPASFGLASEVARVRPQPGAGGRPAYAGDVASQGRRDQGPPRCGAGSCSTTAAHTACEALARNTCAARLCRVLGRAFTEDEAARKIQGLYRGHQTRRQTYQQHPQLAQHSSRVQQHGANMRQQWRQQQQQGAYGLQQQPGMVRACGRAWPCLPPHCSTLAKHLHLPPPSYPPVHRPLAQSLMARGCRATACWPPRWPCHPLQRSGWSIMTGQWA